MHRLRTRPRGRLLCPTPLAPLPAGDTGSEATQDLPFLSPRERRGAKRRREGRRTPTHARRGKQPHPLSALPGISPNGGETRTRTSCNPRAKLAQRRRSERSSHHIRLSPRERRGAQRRREGRRSPTHAQRGKQHHPLSALPGISPNRGETRTACGRRLAALLHSRHANRTHCTAPWTARRRPEPVVAVDRGTRNNRRSRRFRHVRVRGRPHVPLRRPHGRVLGVHDDRRCDRGFDGTHPLRPISGECSVSVTGDDRVHGRDAREHLRRSVRPRDRRRKQPPFGLRGLRFPNRQPLFAIRRGDRDHPHPPANRFGRFRGRVLHRPRRRARAPRTLTDGSPDQHCCRRPSDAGPRRPLRRCLELVDLG